MTDTLLDHPAVGALGWTILHSLWQATALAGLLWLVSRSAGGARLRYGLAYGTMLTQLLVSALTFAYLFEPTPTRAGAAVLGSGEAFAVFVAPAAGGSYWNADVILPWVVLFWLVGLSVGTLRMGVAFGRVRGMQRRATRAVPEAFHQRCHALAQRLGITSRLRIGISDALGGPALVGHLKPMLLFPIAIVNELTPEQAEAVILHELAHLSRQDHWWNLLQCVIEVIFYYHPVMWWISARIREEREHCCDDLVLRHGPGGLPYAKALLYFESQNATPATAVALTNTPGGLLGRVQRFLHQQNIPYQMKSRLFLLPLLTLIALVSTAAYHPAAEAPATGADCASNPAPATYLAPVPQYCGTQKIDAVAPDTLPQGRHEVSSYRNGESTEVVVENGEIKELKINGETVPEAEFERHVPMVEKLLGVDDNRGSTYFFRGGDGIRGFERLEMDLEDMDRQLEKSGIRIERHFESMDDNWEDLGEKLGEMGERLGRSFERMFQFDSDGNTLRFEFRGDEDGLFEFDLDSLVEQGGGSRIFRFDGSNGGSWLEDGTQRREYDIEDILREKENRARDEEAEIREMETMIEKLERRKAEKQRELEQLRTKADKTITKSPASSSSVDLEGIVQTLRAEGLLPDDGPVKKLVLSDEVLKVNGKKASPEAHARFLKLYERQGGKPLGYDFQIKVRQ